MNKLYSSLVLAITTAVVSAQCPIPAAGTSLAVGGTIFDGWTAIQPLGFSFSMKGVSYDACRISDHGLIQLADLTTGLPAAPGTGSFVWDPLDSKLVGGTSPFVAGYWSDSGVSFTAPFGEIWIDNTSGTQCTISWIEAMTYLNGGRFSNSVTFDISGSITFRNDNRVNNEGSTFNLNAVTGIGLPGGTIVTANVGTDVTVADSFSETFTTTASATPNPLFDLADQQITFFDAGVGSGWIVVHAALPCAATVSVGVGCDGLSLASTTPPAIGGGWTLTISGVGATAVGLGLPNFLSFGAPVAGAPIGLLLPGVFGATCLAYQDAAFGLIDVGPASGLGTAAFTLSVPLSLGLVGATLDVQGLSISDSFLFSLSNGQTGTVGY